MRPFKVHKLWMTHISVWSFQRKSYDVTDTIYSIIAMDILNIAHTKNGIWQT